MLHKVNELALFEKTISRGRLNLSFNTFFYAEILRMKFKGDIPPPRSHLHKNATIHSFLQEILILSSILVLQFLRSC